MLFMLFPTPLPLPSSHGSVKNPSKPSSTEAQWTSHLRQVEKQVVVWQGGVWTQGLRQKGQFLRSLGWSRGHVLVYPTPPYPHQTHTPKPQFSRYTLKRKKSFLQIWCFSKYGRRQLILTPDSSHSDAWSRPLGNALGTPLEDSICQIPRDIRGR